MLKKRIIITGVTGFVGTNVNRYLKEKSFKIIGVSRVSRDNMISYQNLSKNHYDNAKAFIHLAGKAHELKKYFGG